MVKHVSLWPWSSYQPMIGASRSPDWLSSEYLLSQFSPQRKTAIKRYIKFVEAGLKHGSIWSQVTNQIYLGDEKFVEMAQQYFPDNKAEIQIPKVQQRAIPKKLSEYVNMTGSRNEAIVLAYRSGGYSYQELGEYFELHFTHVGRIVRSVERQAKC